MTVLSIAAVSINQTPLDWRGNTKRILAAASEAALSHPDIVLFPELCLTGYGCEDAFHSIDVADRAMGHLKEIAEELRKLLPHAVVVLGLPVRKNEKIYNCAAVVSGGKIRGLTAKQNLAGDGVHYEPRWFSPYRGQSETIKIDGEDIPFGSLLFEHEGARFCIEVCEDAWVVSRPASQFIPTGVDIILNPAASHFAFDKQNIRRHIALESSRSFSAVFVMVNLLGCEAGRIIYDGGAIFASLGSLLHEGRRFSFKDFTVDCIPVDIARNRVQRGLTSSYKDQAAAHGPEEQPILLGEGPGRRSIGFAAAAGSKRQVPRRLAGAPVDKVVTEKHEEFSNALTLGLFDYMRKSLARGYVVSLSGGVDSATCAVMVQRMLLRSMAELGIGRALERLNRSDAEPKMLHAVSKQTIASQTPDLDSVRTAAMHAAREILHTIYQSTENSGSVTQSAARAVASALGANHSEVSVQGAVDTYVKTMSSVIGRTLDWKTDDMSLQNIQARARAPMAWLLANITGSLLLTTSNRSEAAVGYCTMDGDTSGGLAPLAGVDKAYLRRWLKDMEVKGDPLGGPIPELALVNVQAPTAELRPSSASQTDEGDLMPYSLLDHIERLAIRDRKPPREIFDILRIALPEYKEEDLKNFVRRFFALWCRNQWKRERYAPSFHLDDENLDPRTFYRFPILSGGYAEELSEL